MTNYLYAGMRHGKPIFFIHASSIKNAMRKLGNFKHVCQIEKIKRVDINKENPKGKIVYLA